MRARIHSVSRIANTASGNPVYRIVAGGKTMLTEKDAQFASSITPDLVGKIASLTITNGRITAIKDATSIEDMKKESQ